PQPVVEAAGPGWGRSITGGEGLVRTIINGDVDGQRAVPPARPYTTARFEAVRIEPRSGSARELAGAALLPAAGPRPRELPAGPGPRRERASGKRTASEALGRLLGLRALCSGHGGRGEPPPAVLGAGGPPA